MSMGDANTSTPYKRLGSILRHLREEHRESVAEASGAVEIEELALASIESGQERPAEDILLLLISHYGLEEERAAELWQLAGYEHRIDIDGFGAPEPDMKQRMQAMMIMLDPRIVYSDGFEVTANKQGVVLAFSQNTDLDSGQPLTVARIGMSYEQAKTVMGVLHQVLYNRDNPTNTQQLGDGKN